jgi:ubiquinone/menaquinone biosynthesis C-methylase UbiE
MLSGKRTPENLALLYNQVESRWIPNMRHLLPLFRLLFHLLYHQFAWAYDLVAALVSLGRWKGWVLSVLPYLDGRVLEIGYGPGHLQAALHERGLATFGLDESRQMAHQAMRGLRRKGFSGNLLRAMAGQIPFPNNSFDTLAATFPAEYIFDAHTLAETRRVLVAGGKLVILPTAWITGNGRLERLAAWLFKVTGEAGAVGTLLPGMRKRLREAGFEVRHLLVEQPGSRVLVIIASKSGAMRLSGDA